MRSLRHRVLEFAALFCLLTTTQLQVMANHFARAVIDPDFFWHVRVGDWILTTGHFPVTGIFSQHERLAWVAYSWGFEVPLALAVRNFGLAALPVSLAIFRALLLFVLFAVLLRISRRFWPSWMLTVVASLPLSDVMVLRPVMFTMLFFVLELALILEARSKRSERPLYGIPLLLLVWANTHIQFVYGLFVLTLFIGSELISKAATKLSGDFNDDASRTIASKLRAAVQQTSTTATPLRLITIWSASVLATLIGPYWGRAYITVFHYVFWTQQYNEISEMISLAFRGANDYCVLLLLIAACFAVARKRLDLFSVSLLISAALVSFRARRDEWFVTIAACAFIAESISHAVADERKRRFAPRPEHFVALLLAGVAALSYAAHVGLTLQNIVPNIEGMYPLAATEYVRSNHLKGPIYNSFDWGGFLIYNLRGYPVSIDGRYDLYGPELYERASNTQNAINWQNDPDLAAANLILMKNDLPLVGALKADPNYKLVYSDNVSAVFVRNVQKP
jgi:hypothetical protein